MLAKLSKVKTPTGLLRSSMLPEASERRLKKIKSIGLKSFKDNYGTCWQCFMGLTGEGLDEWRGEYSIREDHPEECPLCGYNHWKGRIWFPFKYLNNLSQNIENPSRRDSKENPLDILEKKLKRMR